MNPIMFSSCRKCGKCKKLYSLSTPMTWIERPCVHFVFTRGVQKLACFVSLNQMYCLRCSTRRYFMNKKALYTRLNSLIHALSTQLQHHYQKSNYFISHLISLMHRIRKILSTIVILFVSLYLYIWYSFFRIVHTRFIKLKQA